MVQFGIGRFRTSKRRAEILERTVRVWVIESPNDRYADKDLLRSAPPLMVDILLDLSGMKNSQNLVLAMSAGRRHRFSTEALMANDPITGKSVRKDKVTFKLIS